MQNIKQRISRRLAILALLLAGLTGTGLWSWAVVSDSLQLTNQYSVLSLDIEASKDGTVWTQSLTTDIRFDGAGTVSNTLLLRNVGNGEATITISGTGTGSANILSAEYRLYSVASAAACTLPTPTGTSHMTASSTVASASSNVSLVIAPGAQQWLCQVVAPNATPAAGNTAQQVVTFSATSSISNPQ